MRSAKSKHFKIGIKLKFKQYIFQIRQEIKIILTRTKTPTNTKIFELSSYIEILLCTTIQYYLKN